MWKRITREKELYMKFTLPPLPYDYAALEPYIDAQTMEIHYTKHHQGYINNLNEALSKCPDLQTKSLDELMRDYPTYAPEIQKAVRNQGGGHWNHTFFWPLMKKGGGGNPNGSLGDAIKNFFGDMPAFQNQFNAAAKSVFGSGWAWLVLDDDEKLSIITSANQDTPITQGKKPVLGLDVWEHAYYLKYQNRRPDYIEAWWHVVNWDHAQDTYDALLK